MFPYFVFGLMVLRKNELWKKSLIAIPSGVFFCAFVLLEGDSSTNGMNFWNVIAHWKVVLFNLRDFCCFFLRTAVGLCGSIMCLWAVFMLLLVLPRLSSLAQFGVTSLGAYVIHEWVMLQVGLHVPFMPLPTWTRWFVAIAYFMLYHCVVLAIKHFRITNKIFFLK